MTLAEMIASITIVYVFSRLMIPLMEWHEKDKWNSRASRKS